MEPSYVIHKLLDAQRINSLTVYLEEIEARNKSRSEHRNLLISCYAKNKNEEKLKKLLETCDSRGDSNFENIESAIDSLIRAEYIDLAFAFAEKFHHHELAVKILTSHTKQPSRALKYLTKERFIRGLVVFQESTNRSVQIGPRFSKKILSLVQSENSFFRPALVRFEV